MIWLIEMVTFKSVLPALVCVDPAHGHNVLSKLPTVVGDALKVPLAVVDADGAVDELIGPAVGGGRRRDDWRPCRRCLQRASTRPGRMCCAVGTTSHFVRVTGGPNSVLPRLAVYALFADVVWHLPASQPATVVVVIVVVVDVVPHASLIKFTGGGKYYPHDP